jgi:hypothetical protein
VNKNREWGATALLAEIRALGYNGSHNLLVRYLNQGRHLDDHPHLSPRRASRLLLTRPENLTERQRERVEAQAAFKLFELRSLVESQSRVIACVVSSVRVHPVPRVCTPMPSSRAT